MNPYTDAEGNADWDGYAQSVDELKFTEDDKKLIVLMAAYDEARQLSGKESDVNALWRTIVAADAMRRHLGMMP
jgi:hypothetical protein